MPEDLVIRRATLADRSAIVAFHLSLYIDHRDRVMPREIEPFFAHRSFSTVLRDDVDAMLRDRGTIVLIAEKAGAPIGYVTGTTSHDPRRVLPGKGVVGDWYVDEAARGHGAGRALLEALERCFADAGCEVIESATWSFNPGARAAHLALGFHEVQITYRKAIARGRRQ